MSTLTDFQRTRGLESGILLRSQVNPSSTSFVPSIVSHPRSQESASSLSAWSNPRGYQGASELFGALYPLRTVLAQRPLVEIAPSWAGPEDVFREFQKRSAQTQTARGEDDVSNATATFTAMELNPLQHDVHRTTAGASVLPGDSPKVRIHPLNDEAVGAYLSHHPVARAVLGEAIQVLPEFFDAPVDIVLDVPPDYEGEHTQHLYVRIQTSEDVDQALARKDRFNEEWWWQRMTEAPQTMHFTLEFVE